MGPNTNNVSKKGDDLETDGDEFNIVGDGGKRVTLSDLFGAGVSVALDSSSSNGKSSSGGNETTSTTKSVDSRQRALLELDLEKNAPRLKLFTKSAWVEYRPKLGNYFILRGIQTFFHLIDPSMYPVLSRALNEKKPFAQNDLFRDNAHLVQCFDRHWKMSVVKPTSVPALLGSVFMKPNLPFSTDLVNSYLQAFMQNLDTYQIIEKKKATEKELVFYLVLGLQRHSEDWWKLGNHSRMISLWTQSIGR